MFPWKKDIHLTVCESCRAGNYRGYIELCINGRDNKLRKMLMFTGGLRGSGVVGEGKTKCAQV